MNPPSENPLRCLHYLPEIRIETGGVVRMVLDTIRHISDAGVCVTLATHNPQDCPASWLKPGGRVEVAELPKAKYAPLYATSDQLRTIKELIDRHDVIHLHTPWALLNPIIASVAVDLGKAYFITLHGMLDDWSMSQSAIKKRLYLKFFGKNLLEQASRVHCTAESERNQAMKWCPRAQTCVLPILVDLDLYDPQPTPDKAQQRFPHLQQPGLQILFLSRIHVKKGLERLFSACVELKHKGISFQVAVAGPGEVAYVEKLKGMARELGIADEVHWLGMTQGTLKLSLYAASDVFVLPTSQENFGLVFPEALLCGTPVVATRGTDIWQELEQGGAIISENDSLSVAQAIASVVAMTSVQREELGQRGRTHIKQWLDPAVITEQYKQVYLESVRKVG
ncbi:MAG: glycosyltransferase [Planctomycetota bacterium]